MVRDARPHAPRHRRAVIVTTVLLCAFASACTRTTDLAASVRLDASTTTIRIPVKRVPRPTTTIETSTTTVATTETTVAAEAPPAPAPLPDGGTGGLPGLAALVGAVQNATSKGAITPTSPRPGPSPATPPSTAVPPPTTSTTLIPNPPQAIVITATNAQIHPGETQWIDISVDGHRVGTVACGGRDYQATPAGWVNAGFATAADCPVDAAGPRLRRTLPATIAPGQYAFCTEVDPSSNTTVCTPYVVIPYPT